MNNAILELTVGDVQSLKNAITGNWYIKDRDQQLLKNLLDDKSEEYAAGVKVIESMVKQDFTLSLTWNKFLTYLKSRAGIAEISTGTGAEALTTEALTAEEKDTLYNFALQGYGNSNDSLHGMESVTSLHKVLYEPSTASAVDLANVHEFLEIFAVANIANCALQSLVYNAVNTIEEEVLDASIPKEEIEATIDPALIDKLRTHLESVKGITEARDGAAEKHCAASNVVDKKDSEGNTDLYLASMYGNLTVAISLVADFHADINAKNSNGDTALHIAAKAIKSECSDDANNHVGVVNYLVKNGADTTIKNNNGNTALYLAAKRGNLEVVKALIAGGADINAKNSNGDTSLHIAAKARQVEGATGNNHVGVVNYLVKNGADTTIKNNNGKTALDIAKNEEIRTAFVSTQLGGANSTGANNSIVRD